MARNSRTRLPMAIAGLGFGIALGVAGTFYGGRLLGFPGDQGDTFDSADGSTVVASELHRAAENLIASNEHELVAGALADRPIVLVKTADVDRRTLDATRQALTNAGASLAAEVTVTDKFFDPLAAEELARAVSPKPDQVGNEAADSVSDTPPSEESSAPVESALGEALLLDPLTGTTRTSDARRADILGSLSAGGFIAYEEGTVKPGQAVLLVTGGPRGADSDGRVAALAQALDDAGNGAVLAAPVSQLAEGSAIGILRSAPDTGVSTVNTMGLPQGRVLAIRALEEQLSGGVGHYGVGDQAAGVLPDSAQ